MSTAPVRRLPTWYEGGIRFACQRTGRCCTNHGDYSWVYLTGDDEARLVAALGIERRVFRRRYTLVLEGRRVLRSRDGGCVFLADKGCSVHEAKPRQCATWPFWRENLDAKTWRDEVAPFCEGIGKGRLHTREEIDAIAASAFPEDF